MTSKNPARRAIKPRRRVTCAGPTRTHGSSTPTAAARKHLRQMPLQVRLDQRTADVSGRRAREAFMEFRGPGRARPGGRPTSAAGLPAGRAPACSARGSVIGYAGDRSGRTCEACAPRNWPLQGPSGHQGAAEGGGRATQKEGQTGGPERSDGVGNRS